MEFTVIDFSDTYFDRIAKKPKPTQRAGKFMQIKNEDADTEYLVLSPKIKENYLRR